MFEGDWTMSSTTNNYPTLNNEHNCEDLYTQSRNQQKCTSDNHDYIMGCPILDPTFAYVSL